MYDSKLLREKLPGVYDDIEVKDNEPRYPGLTVSSKHSTIFLGRYAIRSNKVFVSS